MEDLETYRSVSLTSVAGKVMEHIILSAIMNLGNQGIKPSEEGFMKCRFCLAILISIYVGMTSLVGKGQIVDVVYLDIRKAFNFPTEFSWGN